MTQEETFMLVRDLVHLIQDYELAVNTEHARAKWIWYDRLVSAISTVLEAADNWDAVPSEENAYTLREAVARWNAIRVAQGAGR